MNVGQVSSTKSRIRFSVDKLAELCLILSALAVVVPSASILLPTVFGKDSGLPLSWPYWVLAAVLSLGVWVGGMVLAIIGLVKAKVSAQPRLVRRQSGFALVVGIVLCWIPWMPLVMIWWTIIGYED